MGRYWFSVLSESVFGSILSSVSNVDFSSFSKKLLLLSELSGGVYNNCLLECNADHDKNINDGDNN